MKLTASIMVTLDGVYQGPGGPDEDRRGGVDRGGRTAAPADKEGGRFLPAYFQRARSVLLERDLVDELNLRLFPVVVGDGLRLFPEQGQTHDLALVESRSTPSGVTIQTYRPAGRATFGNAGE